MPQLRYQKLSFGLLVPKETVKFEPITSFQGPPTKDSDEAWEAFLGRKEPLSMPHS
jgi:hypothetical protein